MAYGTITRPATTLRGIELDMRISPKLGKELSDEITQNVEHTQKFVITELPNWLIVSHKQFVSLEPYTERMYETKDRLFRTPINVMEVEVDEDLDPVLMISEEGNNWYE